MGGLTPGALATRQGVEALSGSPPLGATDSVERARRAPPSPADDQSPRLTEPGRRHQGKGSTESIPRQHAHTSTTFAVPGDGALPRHHRMIPMRGPMSRSRDALPCETETAPLRRGRTVTEGSLDRSPRRDPPMRVQTVTLTPNDAEKLLRDSAGQRQRPLDQARVKLYARKMRDGQWAATHQAIAIDPDGILFDGQHRVAAISAAGIPVDITIAYDADPGTFDLIDTGRSRTPGSTLRIAGYANGNILAASARYLLLYRLLEGTKKAPTSDVRNAWTSHDILRFIEEGGGDWLLGAQTPAARIAQSLGRRGITTWLSAAIAMLQSSGADPVLRNEFLEALENGTMLAAGSPILALRRWISSDTGYIRVPGAYRGMSGMGNFAKAWNAWLNGEQIHVALFRPGTDVLPALQIHAPVVAETA